MEFFEMMLFKLCGCGTVLLLLYCNCSPPHTAQKRAPPPPPLPVSQSGKLPKINFKSPPTNQPQQSHHKQLRSTHILSFRAKKPHIHPRHPYTKTQQAPQTHDSDEYITSILLLYCYIVDHNILVPPYLIKPFITMLPKIAALLKLSLLTKKGYILD